MKPLGLVPSPRRPYGGLFWAIVALGLWLIVTPTVLHTDGPLGASERMMGMLVLMMTTLRS